MRTKAAVAYEAGKPLVIEDVELDGPREGEVLRRHPGYDHSYYFIATLIEDHLRHHARVF